MCFSLADTFGGLKKMRVYAKCKSLSNAHLFIIQANSCRL